MARKSPWQEFAENFDAVYGTFQKIGTNIETSRIMDDEKFTAEGGLGWDAKAGKALEGNALETARYKALGDIYTKYGDAEKGLQVRQQLANLEEQKRSNDLNAAIFNNQVQLLGELAVKREESEIGLNQSQIVLNQENAAKIKKMLGPQFDIAVQQARLAGFTADEAGVNAMLAQSTAGTTLEDRLTTLKANIREKQAIINAADGEISLEQEIMANRSGVVSDAKIKEIEADNYEAKIQSEIALTGAQIDQIGALTKRYENENTTFKERFDAEIANIRADTGLKNVNKEEQAIRNLGLGDLLDAQIDQIVKNTELTEMSAKSQAIQNIIAEATKDTTITAKNLANKVDMSKNETFLKFEGLNQDLFYSELKSSIADANAKGNAAELEVIQSAAFLKFSRDSQAGVFKTDQERSDAFVNTVEHFDPGRAAKLRNEYTAAEIGAIANEGLLIQNQVASILQGSRPMENLKAYFDKKNGDDFGVTVNKNDDGSISMFETGKNGEVVRTLLDSPDVATALQDAQALTTFGNAGGLAELLAGREKSQALLDKLAAEIDSIEAGTTHQEIINDTAKLSEILKQNNAVATTNLAIAQTEKIKADVVANSGLTWDKALAQKAYNAWISGEEYQYQAQEVANAKEGKEKNEATQSLQLYTNRVKLGLGLMEPAPASFINGGMSEEDWLKLNDVQRANYLSLENTNSRVQKPVP